MALPRETVERARERGKIISRCSGFDQMSAAAAAASKIPVSTCSSTSIEVIASK